MQKLLFSIFIFIIFLSCDPDAKRKHAMLHEVEDLQTATLKKHEEISQSVKDWSTSIDSTQEVLADGLSARLTALKKNIDLVRIDAFHNCSAAGHDHDHDHDHDHSHGSSTLELTLEDRITVFKEFLDSLHQIDNQFQSYK